MTGKNPKRSCSYLIERLDVLDSLLVLQRVLLVLLVVLGKLSKRLHRLTLVLHVLQSKQNTFDDDDVVLYSTVTPCYCSKLGALGSVVSFEACCQWALLSVQITRHYPTFDFSCVLTS